MIESSGRRKAIVLVLLIVATIILQLPVLLQNKKITPPGKTLDHYNSLVGDRVYYLGGAMSLLEFDIEKKFNDKPQISYKNLRRVKADDMEWYAKYVLIAYPHSTLKVGFAITAAAITGLFPQKLFKHTLARLAFTNFILMLLAVALIFLIIRRYTESDVGAAIFSLFIALDPVFTHNNFAYETHTMSGIFYLLLAYYIFQRNPRGAGPVRFGLIAFFISFSVFASSHGLFLAASLGLGIYISLLTASVSRIIRLTLAGIVGVAVIPSYIFGVELLFGFRELGITPYMLQFKGYSQYGKDIITEFPLYARAILDMRAFNAFAVLILIILIFILYMQIRDGFGRSFREAWREGRERSRLILLVATVCGLIGTVCYNVPVSRAMMPFLAFGYILLGTWLAARFGIGGRVVRVSAIVVLILFAFNFYLSNRFVTPPSGAPSNCIIEANTPEVTRLSLEEFLDRNGFEKDGLEKDGQCYVRFDALELVIPYAHARRYSLKFTDRQGLVTGETYKDDFRLINEIFALSLDGVLEKDGIKAQTRYLWPVHIWDQESVYYMAYLGGARRYLAGTPLEAVNFRKLYYFRYDSLKEAALKPALNLKKKSG